MAIWVQTPDGFWILNTRPVTKRNTSKIRALQVYTIIFNKCVTLSLTKLHLNIICYYLFTKFIKILVYNIMHRQNPLWFNGLGSGGGEDLSPPDDAPPLSDEIIKLQREASMPSNSSRAVLKWIMRCPRIGQELASQRKKLRLSKNIENWVNFNEYCMNRWIIKELMVLLCKPIMTLVVFLSTD